MVHSRESSRVVRVKPASEDRMPRSERRNSEIENDLVALEALDRRELQERWREVYGTEPSRSMSRLLLLRAVAYRMQEQEFGGLDAVTRRRLERAAARLDAGKPLAASRPRYKPGTRLLREWCGTTHEVTVLEKGVEYRGKRWTSLSAVAREITGARWSGPRFFGLEGRSSGDC